MKSFFRSTRFKILLAAVMLLIGLVLYSVSTGGFSSLPSSIVGAVTTPIQSLSSSISGAVSGFFGQFTSASAKQERIEELEKQINDLQNKMVDYDTYLNENEELRKYLKLYRENPDFVFEDAIVIGRDPAEPFGNFSINKGTLSGIKPNDPVITAEGLVGYVYDVGPIYAKVRTVLDPATAASAIVSRTRDYVMVESNTFELAKNGLCKLNYLPRNSSAIQGDYIITSGVGGIYPRGLIIGTISEIKQEPDGISSYAILTPTADIRNIKDVMVIKSFKGQGEGLPAEANGNLNNNASSNSSGSDSSVNASSNSSAEVSR